MLKLALSHPQTKLIPTTKHSSRHWFHKSPHLHTSLAAADSLTPIFTLDPTRCHQHLWGERGMVSPSASPQQPCSSCRSSAALTPFILEQNEGH